MSVRINAAQVEHQLAVPVSRRSRSTCRALDDHIGTASLASRDIDVRKLPDDIIAGRQGSTLRRHDSAPD